uniref:protein disulfide-isomerase n=1 Tax=Arcella intermedia TaxID=1963864 RepID=A0A6B2L5M2_9EUKA
MFSVNRVQGGFYEGVSFINSQLSANNFAQDVVMDPSVWVVEFYAPWCPHCKNFQSDFTLAAENLKGIINFGAVDCDVEENKPICGYFKVESLPTIFLFKSYLEGEQVEGKKVWTKNPIKYVGEMKPVSIVKWASQYLLDPFDPVIDITDESSLDQVFKNIQLKNRAILFSDKQKKSNLMRSVAIKFRPDTLTKHWILIGQASNTQTELVSKYEIDSFPKLIIVDDKGKKLDTFAGQFTNSEISDFLKKYAQDAVDPQINPVPPEAQKAEPKPREAKLYHVTDQASFDTSCFQHGLCLIVFLDPQAEEHPSFLETLNSLVSHVPSVQVLWMDGNKHSNLVDAFGVASSFPQAVAYQRKSKRYRNFLGGFSEDQLNEFIILVQSGSSKKGRIATLQEEPKILTEQKEEL